MSGLLRIRVVGCGRAGAVVVEQLVRFDARLSMLVSACSVGHTMRQKGRQRNVIAIVEVSV